MVRRIRYATYSVYVRLNESINRHKPDPDFYVNRGDVESHALCYWCGREVTQDLKGKWRVEA